MRIGPVTNKNNPLPPMPEPTPELYSIDMYCSNDQTCTRLIVKSIGSRDGDAIYGVVERKIVSNSGGQGGSMLKDPPSGSVRGDARCLRCDHDMFAYCNGCNRWYCGATKEETKEGTWHTCPVHGRGKLAGVRPVDPNNNNKKK
jgi:hypothetical protein